MEARERNRSIWEMRAPDTEGRVIRPGQEMTAGMRVPPSFEGAVLAAAEASCDAVVSDKLSGGIRVAVVQHRSVVAGEDDDGVVPYSGLLEGVENLTDAVVKLQDGLAPEAHRALAAESLVGHARHMHVVGGEIQEERPAAVLPDEFYGVGGNRVRDILILPQGLAAAFHVADAAYAVDHRIVMTVGRAELELRGRSPVIVGNILERAFVAHLHWGGGVEVRYPSVFNKYARSPVGGSGHDIVSAEA